MGNIGKKDRTHKKHRKHNTKHRQDRKHGNIGNRGHIGNTGNKHRKHKKHRKPAQETQGTKIGNVGIIHRKHKNKGNIRNLGKTENIGNIGNSIPSKTVDSCLKATGQSYAFGEHMNRPHTPQEQFWQEASSENGLKHANTIEHVSLTVPKVREECMLCSKEVPNTSWTISWSAWVRFHMKTGQTYKRNED